MFTPETRILFLNVPWSIENNKILKFQNLSSQQEYFQNKVIYSKTNCKYQRQNDYDSMKVNITYENMINCNYIAFQNKGGKWFYAFITKIEFINYNTTSITFKIDVMQTFQFDISFSNSFIERETLNTDLYNSLADYVSQGELHDSLIKEVALSGKYVVYLNSEINSDDSSVSEVYFPKVGDYSIPNYVMIYSDGQKIAKILQEISNKGRADRIQTALYQPFLPIDCVTQIGSHDKGDLNLDDSDLFFVSEINYQECKKDVELSISSDFVYKKELTYPYCKIEVVDKITGDKIELDLSKFENPIKPKFRILGSIGEIPEYKVIPLNYNGIDYAIDYALVVNPNTELPVFSNSYAKYLKDNKTQNIINGVMSGASAIGSIFTGNVAGAVGSFANIASLLNADSVAKSQPNLCRGTSSNTCEYVNLNNGVEFRLLTMDDTHKNQARQYWKYFGYPIKEFKKISIPNQEYYFIKTSDINIFGNIPSQYLGEISNIFNQGVSFHNSENSLINY